MMLRPFYISSALLASLALLGACARKQPVSTAEPPFSREHPRRIIFQSDWFPQAEHGGFYQALERGYYAEAGLDVTILPGGPGSTLPLKVARGDVDFAMYRSDNLVLAIAKEGLPLLMIAAVTQHDHEALMVHADSPVRTFSDLNGRTIIASPGQAWISFLLKKYRISFNQIPNKGGLGAFLADADAIQQCIYTNEPFIARQQGVKVRTLALADAGYDSYTVIFSRRDFAQNNPAATRAFVAASLRGWHDFLEGDPAPAFAEILRRNPNMSPAFLAFSRTEMIRHRIINGDPAQGEDIGRLSARREQREIETLVELGMLAAPVAVKLVATEDYLPPVLR